MTLTEEILSLSLSPGGSDAAHSGTGRFDQARADLAAFAEAAGRGADSAVARAIRDLRPRSRPGSTAVAQDDAAWAAWVTAAAAMAGASADPAWRGRPEAPAVPVVVCAAAAALGDDCQMPVAAGTRAASLVATRLAGTEGWSVPVVAATIGATVAAATMLSLTEGELRHALGIAATQAAGLRAAGVTDAGPVQAGKAAFNAVEAVFLARVAFTSSRDPLEGRRGLLALFARRVGVPSVAPASRPSRPPRPHSR